jgi:hypothetical protein
MRPINKLGAQSTRYGIITILSLEIFIICRTTKYVVDTTN